MSTTNERAHTDAGLPSGHVAGEDEVAGPSLTIGGWARWGWRQLTSMRTALVLLLFLALAAVPGSVVPQQSSDPNGVITFDRDNTGWAWAVSLFQLHDVFGSTWFSAIYLLLFISLVGCVIPRIRHHARALRASPPDTPRNLSRLAAYGRTHHQTRGETDVLQAAEQELRRQRYRVVRVCTETEQSIAAERGYLRETGNLLFHIALLAILLVLAIGSGFRFTGQRVLVEGQTFASTRIAYDSFTAGRFVTDAQIPKFALTLNSFRVGYVSDNLNALGMPRDFDAAVTVESNSRKQKADIRVNDPMPVDGTDIFLLGNGYAPTITVRNPAGAVVFSDSIPFLPQDSKLTSLGVIKVPDGLAKQVGMIGLFYPTHARTPAGASYSSYPDLLDPVVSLDVYVGDLGLNSGVPVSVYTLDTSRLTKVAGRGTATPGIQLTPNVRQPLPNGLGSIELTTIPRFASLDIAYDPTQGPMLAAVAAAVAGLALSLFVPRRRVWVRTTRRDHGADIEIGALARGDDPRLQPIVDAFIARLHTTLDNKGDRA